VSPRTPKTRSFTSGSPRSSRRTTGIDWDRAGKRLLGMEVRSTSVSGSSILRVAVYPAVMTATVASAILLYERGLPAVAVVAAVVFAGAAVIFALERVLPYRREWLVPRGDVRTDVCHLVFSGALAEAGRALLLAGTVRAAIALAGA